TRRRDMKRFHFVEESYYTHLYDGCHDTASTLDFKKLHGCPLTAVQRHGEILGPPHDRDQVSAVGRLPNEFVRRIIGYDYYRGRARDEFDLFIYQPFLSCGYNRPRPGARAGETRYARQGIV
ncbi:MAG: hypothetical protein ACREYF_05600, partial [Gammaproteobacteria bacterium]